MERRQRCGTTEHVIYEEKSFEWRRNKRDGCRTPQHVREKTMSGSASHIAPAAVSEFGRRENDRDDWYGAIEHYSDKIEHYSDKIEHYSDKRSEEYLVERRRPGRLLLLLWGYIS